MKYLTSKFVAKSICWKRIVSINESENGYKRRLGLEQYKVEYKFDELRRNFSLAHKNKHSEDILV